MRLTALVVDDEDDLLDLLAEEFESAGFSVTKADSGAAAETLIANHNYHLLVFDYRVGSPNGLDLVEQALKKKSSKDSTIWVMTGAVDKSFVNRLVEAKIDLFLQKPIDLDEMRNCLIEAFPQIQAG